MKKQKVWAVIPSPGTEKPHISVQAFGHFEEALDVATKLSGYAGRYEVAEATLLIEEDPEWAVTFWPDSTITLGCLVNQGRVASEDVVVRAKDAQSALAAALKLREGK